MKRGAADHPKMHDLAGRLNIPIPYANGIMVRIWEYTDKYACRGDIGRVTDAAIAGAAVWPGDPQEFVAHLVGARLLDQHPEFRLVVHDWADHCDEYTHRKVALAGETFCDGREPRTRKLSTKAEKDLAAERRAARLQRQDGRQTSAQYGATTAPHPGATTVHHSGASYGAIKGDIVAHRHALPSHAIPNQTAASHSAAGGEVQHVAGDDEAQPDRPATKDPPGLAEEKIVMPIARTLLELTGDKVDYSRVARIVREKAAAGHHPYLVLAWIREFVERKRAAGTKAGIGLVFTAVATDFDRWAHGPGGRALCDGGRLAPIGSQSCGRCGNTSVQFDDGTLVPCGCKPRVGPKLVKTGDLAALSEVVAAR